jgi:hypothetical protein
MAGHHFSAIVKGVGHIRFLLSRRKKEKSPFHANAIMSHYRVGLSTTGNLQVITNDVLKESFSLCATVR